MSPSVLPSPSLPPLASRQGASLCCALALLLLFPTPGKAQEGEQTERNWHLGIALGAGERSNPLVSGDDIDIHAVIDFSWYGKRFFFDNGDFGYTLYQDSNLSVSLLASINNERSYYSYLTGKQLRLDSLFGQNLELGSSFVAKEVSPTRDQDGATLGPTLSPEELAQRNRDTALPDRDYAANGGMELLYVSPYGDLQLQLLSDVSSTHEGQEAWVSWTKAWYTRNTEFSFTAGLEWQSDALISYYYGITPAESFEGRPAYESGSGTNRFMRLGLRHSFNEHWQLVGMAEREFLSDAIRQSPIVDSHAIDTFFTGLYYAF
ncbi:MAG TPA: MipA/OmpV family protein [Hyphomicrobiales bacterium]|nr:MipA/OmpV family protein [Hyphomicrobiales bacterium]